METISILIRGDLFRLRDFPKIGLTSSSGYPLRVSAAKLSSMDLDILALVELICSFLNGALLATPWEVIIR